MLASSMTMLLARKKKIIAVDCDVDAPNLGLCLGLKDSDYDSWKEITTNEKAELTEERCIGCKKCMNVCAFNAIQWDKIKNKPIIDRMFCEGCGACLIICPANALKLKEVKNARIGIGITRYGFPVVSGQLSMGESGSGKIVFVTKKTAEDLANKAEAEIMMIDSAAGIGCPVIASITGSDFVVAVTEPTPSAFSDVERVIKVVEHFRIPYGLVINKHDLNKEFTKKVDSYAVNRHIPVLGKIPYDRKFVEAMVKMMPIVEYDKGYEGIFSDIVKKIGNIIQKSS